MLNLRLSLLLIFQAVAKSEESPKQDFAELEQDLKLLQNAVVSPDQLERDDGGDFLTYVSTFYVTSGEVGYCCSMWCPDEEVVEPSNPMEKIPGRKTVSSNVCYRMFSIPCAPSSSAVNYPNSVDPEKRTMTTNMRKTKGTHWRSSKAAREEWMEEVDGANLEFHDAQCDSDCLGIRVGTFGCKEKTGVEELYTKGSQRTDPFGETKHIPKPPGVIHALLKKTFK